MTKRVVIGTRANGTVGIFVSPVGVDADTAPDSALIMNVSSRVSQLIALGRVASSSTVALGLSRSPYVFITSEWDFSGVPDHTLGLGPVRPSPPALVYPHAYCVINGNGASMSVVISSSFAVNYQVYGQAFT